MINPTAAELELVLDSIAKPDPLDCGILPCVACGIDTRRADVFRCNSSDCRRTNGHLDRGILSNSQRTPKYSLAVTYLIGAVILVCMGLGIWIGVAYGY